MHVAQKRALGPDPRVRSGFGATTCTNKNLKRVGEAEALQVSGAHSLEIRVKQRHRLRARGVALA